MTGFPSASVPGWHSSRLPADYVGMADVSHRARGAQPCPRHESATVTRSSSRPDYHVVAYSGIDVVAETEAGDAIVVGVEGRLGFSPRTGPKASMSGFLALAQFRPDPVVILMVMPIGLASRTACWICKGRGIASALEPR